MFLTVAVYLLAGSSDRGFITDKQIEASVNELKKEAKDVFIATKDLALETKERLRDTLESELEDVESEMKKLRKKARKASDKEKKALSSRLAKLERKENALQKKLKKLGYTDKTFWGKMKGRIRKAADGLRGAWNSFLSWFGDDKKSVSISL